MLEKILFDQRAQEQWKTRANRCLDHATGKQNYFIKVIIFECFPKLCFLHLKTNTVFFFNIIYKTNARVFSEKHHLNWILLPYLQIGQTFSFEAGSMDLARKDLNLKSKRHLWFLWKELIFSSLSWNSTEQKQTNNMRGDDIFKKRIISIQKRWKNKHY